MMSPEYLEGKTDQEAIESSLAYCQDAVDGCVGDSDTWDFIVRRAQPKFCGRRSILSIVSQYCQSGTRNADDPRH